MFTGPDFTTALVRQRCAAMQAESDQARLVREAKAARRSKHTMVRASRWSRVVAWIAAFRRPGTSAPPVAGVIVTEQQIA